MIDIKKMPMYLDNQATTPTDPRVVKEMVPYFYENFGNAHSRNHAWGWAAEEACENGRKQLATLIGANAKDIIFTSGATESNNLAIKGVMEFYAKKGKNHVIVSKIEHKCVLMSAAFLESHGYKVTYLAVNDKGMISLDELKKAITKETALVSIMAVNNEIGIINDIKSIGKICRENGVFFHTDAAQAVGKIPVNVDENNIDLMSISGHKFYGPKGVGALYIRRKPRVRLVPQIHGGGQERGLRSGTLPVPLCVGIGKAAELAMQEMNEDKKVVGGLLNYLKTELEAKLPKIYVNGDESSKIYNTLNISFAGVEGESLLMGINKDIAVSSGSACTSASLESSYVLKALGVSEDLAHTSFRFGVGRFTTKEEIDKAIELISNTVNKLRAMSPIWEMMEKGIDLKTIEWAEH